MKINKEKKGKGERGKGKGERETQMHTPLIIPLKLTIFLAKTHKRPIANLFLRKKNFCFFHC